MKDERVLRMGGDDVFENAGGCSDNDGFNG